jgi:starch phosphorylase
MKPLRTFNVTTRLPPALERLREISYDLRWAWSHSAIELCRWENDLWEASRNNPVKMLNALTQSALEGAAGDEGFLAHLDRVAREFEAYRKSDATWFRAHHGRFDRSRIAYFSAEFDISDCLSIFAGGLGILAGDHLKSASDLGVPLAGIGLLYQQGYFRQYLNQAGWQQEAYEDNDFYNLPPESGTGRRWKEPGMHSFFCPLFSASRVISQSSYTGQKVSAWASGCFSEWQWAQRSSRCRPESSAGGA